MLQRAEAPDGSSAASADTSSLQSRLARDASLWDTSDAERRLALELENVLNRKPTLDVESGALASKLDGRSVASATPSPNITVAEADDFEWSPDRDGTLAGLGSGISMQWLDRARRQHRRERSRHALAWLATVAIGGAILAAAAFVLTGSVPDVQALRELAMRMIE